MQGGAMLSVIRLIANYLERGTTQRTSMPSGGVQHGGRPAQRHHGRPTDWVPSCEAIGHPELADRSTICRSQGAGRKHRGAACHGAADLRREAHRVAGGALHRARHHERQGEHLRGVPEGPAGERHRHHLLAGPARRPESRCRCRTFPACHRCATARSAPTPRASASTASKCWPSTATARRDRRTARAGCGRRSEGEGAGRMTGL